MRSLATSRSNFKIQIMSLVSALDKNENLESFENSSEDSPTDSETDFEKHDDRIGFSTPACFSKHNKIRSVHDASRLIF